MRERIIELLRQHQMGVVNLVRSFQHLSTQLDPKMPDFITYKCNCGWNGDDPHGHVADSIIKGLELR